MYEHGGTHGVNLSRLKCNWETSELKSGKKLDSMVYTLFLKMHYILMMNLLKSHYYACLWRYSSCNKRFSNFLLSNFPISQPNVYSIILAVLLKNVFWRWNEDLDDSETSEAAMNVTTHMQTWMPTFTACHPMCLSVFNRVWQAVALWRIRIHHLAFWTLSRWSLTLVLWVTGFFPH